GAAGNESEYGAQQRRLTGPVGAYDADERALLRAQADVAQDLATRPVAGTELTDFEHSDFRGRRARLPANAQRWTDRPLRAGCPAPGQRDAYRPTGPHARRARRTQGSFRRG